MRKSTIAIVLTFGSLALSGQDISVTYTGAGAAARVDTDDVMGGISYVRSFGLSVRCLRD